MQIDQTALARLYRRGVRAIQSNDLGRVIQRSRRLQQLITGPVAEMGEEIDNLFSMVRDYRNGAYRDLPRSTVFASTFALLYLLNPFDLMPDFLPGIGFIDDMSMLALVMGSIRRDVAAYMRWRRSRAAIARRLRLTFGLD